MMAKNKKPKNIVIAVDFINNKLKAYNNINTLYKCVLTALYNILKKISYLKMAERRRFIGGNWKSNNTLAKSLELVDNVVNKLEF